MGDVIELDARRQPSFMLDAKMGDDGNWMVSVSYFDKSVEEPEAFREISEALVSIFGGLINAAEGKDPSKRGALIANIGIYEDGAVNIHCPFDMTPAMGHFIIQGLEDAKRKIRDLTLKKATEQ